METIKRDPRGQGEQGEVSALCWLLSHGWPVFLPVAGSRDVDLVTIMDERALRVQVKTSTQRRKGRWEVSVCTRGGNRSWSGLVKLLDPRNYDWLFVLVGDGRRWFIPADQVGAGTRIVVGGRKYGEFEIEPGEPLRNYRPSLH